MSATLATPLTLPSGAVLTNRLAKAALSEQLGTRDHAPSRGLDRLYGRWADSGAGLLVTGNVMVDRTAIGEPRNVAVQDERDLPRLTEWATIATAGGAHVWAQLNHPGRQVVRILSSRPVAPSAVGMRGMAGIFATPRSLTAAEIERLIGRFAITAGIMVKAGFTGVQIHAAHGYLISQFLSPLTNRRDDAWGGTPAKRRRFLLEVVAAVRAEVGAGVPVSVKLNSADFQRGGFTEAESLEVVAELRGIDLLEVSGGTYETPALVLGNPKESTRKREAYFLEFAERARAVTTVPLMLTGGFRTRAGMTDALTSGAVDVIGLGRPMALEPELPTTLLSGAAEASAVRPRRVGIRKLDGLSEVVWYTDQLWRMGKGAEPNPNRHPLRSILHYTTAAGIDALLRRRVSGRPPYGGSGSAPAADQSVGPDRASNGSCPAPERRLPQAKSVAGPVRPPARPPRSGRASR